MADGGIKPSCLRSDFHDFLAERTNPWMTPVLRFSWISLRKRCLLPENEGLAGAELAPHKVG